MKIFHRAVWKIFGTSQVITNVHLQERMLQNLVKAPLPENGPSLIILKSKGVLGYCKHEKSPVGSFHALPMTDGGTPDSNAYCQACVDLQGNGDLLDIL